MIVIFLGPPGSGKGTQASILCKKYNLAKISTGDIFRGLASQDTPLANKISAIMKSGGLVDDQLVTEVVTNYLKDNNLQDNFMLDGFPRTVPQAESFDEYVRAINKQITVVFNLDVPDEILIKRITSRVTCKKCGEVYNIEQNLQKCVNCGSVELHVRHDDNADTVRKRIENFNTQTLPIIEYYKKQGLLVRIDGTKLVEEVTKQIISRIEAI